MILRTLIEKLYFRYCVDRAESFNAGEEKMIMEEVGKHDQIRGLFRFYMERDRDRYFLALDDNARSIIKGQYRRTAYMIKLMQSPQKGKPSPSKTLGIKRYG